MEMDENNSWHFDDTIWSYGVKGNVVKLMDNFADPVYVLNLKENINGFIRQRRAVRDEEGERVR